MLYFYVYTGTNYEADMKLNVFRWTNILLQYSMVKNDRFGLHFCFPWRRPCDYRAKCYINRKTIECLQMSRSTYPSICNSFPVIRTASAKKSPFSRTAAHIFVSSGDAPAITTQYVAWMESNYYTNASRDLLVARTVCRSVSAVASADTA